MEQESKTKASSRRKTKTRLKSSGKRDQNKERTKEKILKVALDLFRKHGLEGTTTKQVSKGAGIAEGTLFNYFKTKEDLALYFFQKETEKVIERYRGDARLAAAPLPEKLFALIHQDLESIAPYEQFIGSVIFRAIQPSSKLHPLSFESQELRLKRLSFLREILADAEQREEIPPVGQLGAYALGLFYVGIVAHWLHDTSEGKGKTLALLDRSLQIATRVLKKGGWDW
jgi:AcrR family transcriptional regulator